MADFSIGDALALMNKDNDKGFGDGAVGWIILLFIFLLAISGGGLFGGKSNATNDTATTAELYSALGSQDTKNDIRTGFASVAQGQFGLSKDILENRFTTQLGFQNAQAQMASCCCDIKSTIMSENEKTRELIQNNYIEGLRTALSDTKTALNNAQQSEYLLGVMGRWRAFPSCGCGCNGANNLI